MDQNHITTVTRSLQNRPTRRNVLRGLAATGLGLGALRLSDPVEARKKKRNKRKKRNTNTNNQQTCTPGTQFGAVNVPATGASASTPVLIAGQRYRLRASGFWNTNATDGNDAVAAFPFANPNAPVLVAGGVRVGLSVDGGSPDVWGSYTTGHIYELQVTGQGAALSLRYTDPIPTDNSGSLLVDVFCA
jgi:hypothetical protein